MSWTKIEAMHREKYQREFILCRDKEERDFIVNAITSAFNFVRREDVEKTFDHFCRSSVYPPVSELFLARIKEHLGRQITNNYVERYKSY